MMVFRDTKYGRCMALWTSYSDGLHGRVVLSSPFYVLGLNLAGVVSVDIIKTNMYPDDGQRSE